MKLMNPKIRKTTHVDGVYIYYEYTNRCVFWKNDESKKLIKEEYEEIGNYIVTYHRGGVGYYHYFHVTIEDKNIPLSSETHSFISGKVNNANAVSRGFYNYIKSLITTGKYNIVF